MAIPPSTRTDEAYVAIKQRIICLEIPPGGTFTEGQLATELGFGKTPVREALTRLQQEGLVQANARAGYVAASVTLQDAKELMALRALLEAEAASLAALQLKDANHLQMLNELCRVSYDPTDRASIARFLRANTEFHLTVARAGGSTRLARILEQILAEHERLFHLGLALTSRADEIVHEHEDLLSAIMRGDPEGAREIALEQCRTSQKMVLDALLSSPSLLSANIVATPQLSRKATS